MQQGINLDYTYAVTGPDGVQRQVSLAGALGAVFAVANYSTTVKIWKGQAVVIVPEATAVSPIPTTPGGSAVNPAVLYGQQVASAAICFLGVALEDIPVKDTTKPVNSYSGLVAGMGSIVMVECPTGIASTLGTGLKAHTVAGQVTNGAVLVDGTFLGSLIKSKVTGAKSDGSAAFYVGCLVRPT